MKLILSAVLFTNLLSAATLTLFSWKDFETKVPDSKVTEYINYDREKYQEKNVYPTIGTDLSKEYIYQRKIEIAKADR